MQEHMNEVEPADMLQLVASMVRAMLAPGWEATEDSFTTTYPVEQLCKRAHTAVSVIAEMAPDDPENWDGVLWYERFTDEGEGSLAQALLCKCPAESATVNWLRQKY